MRRRGAVGSWVGAFTVLLASSIGCAGGAGVSAATPAPSGADPAKLATPRSAPSPAGKTGGGAAKPGPPKGKKLTVAQARRYMLELINRDRASMGLAPVVLDEGPAQVAGQRHAEDMARHGFLGHWGSDGSVPEQRYTEAGGADFVMENAACVTDEKTRELDSAPLIEVEALERTQSMFFNEVPPNDGHRKNILKPEHKSVGIGIAQAKATPTELPGLCLTQEFVDSYGTYEPLPKQAKAGSSIRVAGSVRAPAKFGGVGIARLDPPKPIPIRELNRRRSYSIPAPYEVYWPKGFKTSIPVEVKGSSFSIGVPLARGPGLYAVSIMGQYPGQKSFGMIGLRTIEVK